MRWIYESFAARVMMLVSFLVAVFTDGDDQVNDVTYEPESDSDSSSDDDEDKNRTERACISAAKRELQWLKKDTRRMRAKEQAEKRRQSREPERISTPVAGHSWKARCMSAGQWVSSQVWITTSCIGRNLVLVLEEVRRERARQREIENSKREQAFRAQEWQEQQQREERRQEARRHEERREEAKRAEQRSIARQNRDALLRRSEQEWQEQQVAATDHLQQQAYLQQQAQQAHAQRQQALAELQRAQQTQVQEAEARQRAEYDARQSRMEI
eukprot:1619734-Rhodomonas_salina.3